MTYYSGAKNGNSRKTLTTSAGKIAPDIPHARASIFELQFAKKNLMTISDRIENKTLSKKKLSMRLSDISDHVPEMKSISLS